MTVISARNFASNPHAASSSASQNRRTLAAAALGFCLEMMDIMLLSYALRLIIADFSLSLTQAGFISTATNLAMLVGGLAFGALANRLGYVRSFAASIYFFAAGTALIYFAPSFETLVALRVLAGLGAGGEYGLSMALLAARFPREKLGRYSAIVGVFGQLGAASAALAAGLLLASGWRPLFLLGLIPLALGIYVQFCLKEPEISAKKSSKIFEEILQKKSLVFALIFMACVQIAGYFGLMSWLPTMAAKALNLGVLASSSYWMLATIAGMCAGMLVFGSLLDRFGARLSFGLFLLGSSAGVWAFAAVSSYSQLLIAGFLIGFFSNGMFAGYGAIISKIFSTKNCAFANNLIIGCGRAVGGFSALGIGTAMDLGASQAQIMAAIAAMYLSSFCVCMIFLGAKNLQKNCEKNS